jgi:hypothetical protein
LLEAIDPIKVMYARAVGGARNAKRAFDALESKLPTLRGRRFYGAYDRTSGEYRACVRMVPEDDPAALGLDVWTIPGGTYSKLKVIDWGSKLHLLPHLFDGMAEGRKVDPDRPSLEFYRSESELVLYLPVKD